MKQRLIALAIIFLAWSGLDFLFHGVLLAEDYEATAQLWRPMAEMNTLLMNVSTILIALTFILVYCQLIKEKNMENAVKWGVLAGCLVGIGMSLGSYSYMPITPKIALVWFVATVVEFTVAGAVVGKIVTKELNS